MSPRRRNPHRRVVRAAGSPGQAPSGADPGTPGPPRVQVTPEQTRDDTDLGWGERVDGADSPAEQARGERERWEADRPPHWG